MDHPIGQLFALREAATFYASNGVTSPPPCGLITHDLYEPTPYHSLLGPARPTLTPPSVADLTDLLEREQWTPLTA